ncbi:DUF3306 domain-containing protein [Fodinicurvata halophila]|uniref:DUF3306 domain-containing protein n=1 Tax=Fodinicurvata halophila TaxID=1419723 RepID=A0ABV8ULV2_9PROT
MSDEDATFLRRWSLRKRGSEEQARHKQQEEDAQAEIEKSEPSETGEEEVAQAPDDLPDPETLGRDADWSAFLKKGVPESVRYRALQRLWRLDPVYSNLDGLVDYADDYNDPVLLSRKVKTLFQVGKGMVLPESEQKDTAGKEEKTRTTVEGELAVVPAESDLPEAESAAVAAPEAHSDTPLSENSESSSLRNHEIAPQAKKAESLREKSGDSALKRRWGQS